MRHCLGLATRTQISVCKSPFPSAGTAVGDANTVPRNNIARLAARGVDLPRPVTKIPEIYVTRGGTSSSMDPKPGDGSQGGDRHWAAEHNSL